MLPPTSKDLILFLFESRSNVTKVLARQEKCPNLELQECLLRFGDKTVRLDGGSNPIRAIVKRAYSFYLPAVVDPNRHAQYVSRRQAERNFKVGAVLHGTVHIKEDASAADVAGEGGLFILHFATGELHNHGQSHGET